MAAPRPSDTASVHPTRAERPVRSTAKLDLAYVSLDPPPPEPLAIARLLEAAGGRLPPDLAARLGWRDPHVAHLIRALLAEVDSPAPAGPLYVRALSTALAHRLAQIGGPAASRCRGQTLTARQMRRVEELVAASPGEDLSLTRIAAAAGISVSHLTPMFRRTTGRSVHRYVLERRVDAARSLLTTTRSSVAEIALRTGFSHQSHLAKWMRRLIGASPRDIRRGLDLP